MAIYDPWSIDINSAGPRRACLDADPMESGATKDWMIPILNLTNNLINIKGPLSSKTKERYILEFIIENNGNFPIKIYTKENENGSFKHLYIKIFKEEAYIENISKSSIYRGSEYMILGLQIIFNLKISRCKLVDSSYFICDRQMNFFHNSGVNISKKEEIQNKMISLFRFQTTYYMPFGFIPYSKNNNTNMRTSINNLVIDLYYISWNEINDYINSMLESIKNKEKYKNDYKIRNYKKFVNYWINLEKSWNIFYKKYVDKSPSPFRSFTFFNYDECNIFINWLELYSFTYYEYNNMIYEKEIPGSVLFKKLKNILLDVIWLNNNINIQPMISIYIDKF